MRLLISALLAALIATQAPPAAAAPSADFARARDVWSRGDYKTAVPLLTALLYPRAKLSDAPALAEAHLMLAVAHFELDSLEDAKAEFNRSLRYDDDPPLDTMFLTTEAKKFFENLEAEYKRRKKEEERLRKLAEERDAYRRALENMVVIEKRPYYVNFIPFGAGQFQNGQNGKGLFFSISQGLTGGSSLLIFAYHALKYDFGGKVPREDAASVRRLQQIQIAAGLTCVGLMAWGIVDSLMNYEPNIIQKPDESLLPDKYRPEAPGKPGKPKPSTKKSAPQSWRVAPMPLPNGGGAVLTWEF